MITRIINIDSVKGSGRITFGLNATGAVNEKITANIGGTTFETTATGAAGQVLNHTKSGLHTFILKAETSNVSSDAITLDL